MEYKSNILVDLITAIFSLIGSIFLLSIFFQNNGYIGGWKFEQALIIQGIYTILNGITNTQTLASYSEKQLGEKLSIFKDQKYEKASVFVKQAKAYISGEPYRISNKNDTNDLLEKTYSGFYIFDIESNPDDKLDFLYGFLKINNLFIKKEELIYQPILNLKNNKEESYRQIIEILFSHKEWPVLHYGETEKISIINIA